MNAKDFSVTEIVSENIFPTGAREDAGILTVVLDPNTEKEKVLSKTVRKGDLFGIVFMKHGIILFRIAAKTFWPPHKTAEHLVILPPVSF